MELAPSPKLKHWPICQPNYLNTFYASLCYKISIFTTFLAVARGYTTFATEGERSGGTSTNSGAIFSVIWRLWGYDPFVIWRVSIVCVCIPWSDPNFYYVYIIGCFFFKPSPCLPSPICWCRKFIISLGPWQASESSAHIWMLYLKESLKFQLILNFYKTV